jgi:hypothetical protein
MQMIDHKCVGPEQLKDEMTEILNGFSKLMMARVLNSWMSRLNTRTDFEGEWVHSMRRS